MALIPTEQPIRLSLTSIVVGLLVVVGLGLAGGFLAQQLLPTAAPLAPVAGGLPTTVQNVTISPTTVTAAVVTAANRSVVLLGNGEAEPTSFLGMASVLTNDGVLVTAADVAGSKLFAYDEQGVAIPLDVIGKDSLYGLTYLRLTTSVFPPLEVRADDPLVGAQLLALGRSGATMQPRIQPFTIYEYALLADVTMPAIHRVITGPSLKEGTMVGTPLLDEEGRLAAVVLKPAQGVALPTLLLKESLQRVVSQQREADPMHDLGVTLRPVFLQSTASDPFQFGAEVSGIVFDSPAQTAGIAVGDQITGVADAGLRWEASLVQQLSRKRPFQVKVNRRGEILTLTIE